MSDNKKYYYIKLKDNYFERDNIKILEAQENGYIYSLIILKLYLKSAKHDGCLMMTDRIPYDPNKLDVLAKVLNHDVAHIKDALAHAKELDLISIMDTGQIFMTEIQNFLGHSSSEADRKREYRRLLDSGQMSGQMSDKNPPEKELELKKELERERETKNYTNTDLIIDYFNSKTGKKLRHKDISRKPIKARLNEGYTIDDCKKVIDIKYDEWRYDENMSKYIRISTLFGNKFEVYLNQETVKSGSTVKETLKRLKESGHVW